MHESKAAAAPDGFVRGLGLLNSTMIVAGSMIGSGIFIVSADIARQVGSPGWLLMVWIIAGILTIIAALSYGELAAMLPRAGGQYIYLREAFGPLWSFLYGWALFFVIQTGTIAAVSIAFARFLGVIWPAITADRLLLDGGILNISGIGNLSLSISAQQSVAIASVLLLTCTNLTGLRAGKLIQDTFTLTKVGALIGLIGLGFFSAGPPDAAIHAPGFWTPAAEDGSPISMLSFLLVIATAMVGALFSADAWNNITFTGEEVRDPQRNIPLSMALGAALVILLYMLANVVYIATLPLEAIQHAPGDRVAVSAAQAIFGENAQTLMAVAIMISCFGCNNGMILAGARVYYAMARDGLFFKNAGSLNRFRVPGTALVLQAIWATILTLPRTYNETTGQFSNLYSNLLDYIVFVVLLFYILTIAGTFALRRKHPNLERPVQVFGYPVLPMLYILCAGLICVALLIAEKTRLNAGLGLLLVLAGLPAYFVWRKVNRRQPA